MAFPKQYEIEIPLLRTIQELGGSGKTTEIYPRVSKHFPQLSIQSIQPRWGCLTFSIPHPA